MVTSALEARKLTEQERNAQVKQELDEIDMVIRRAAMCGDFSVDFHVNHFTKKAVMSALLSAGYVILEDGGDFLDISWSVDAVARSGAW